MGTRTDEVVDAALTVAARDGIGHLSMRAVAAEVGVTVMALYRHVANKEALLDAMVGRMLGHIDLPADDLSWKPRLRRIAHEMLALAERYPTVLPLLLTRTYVAQEAVRLVQALYAVFEEAGVPRGRVYRLERMFSTQMLGYVISVANNAFWATEPATLEIDQPPGSATGRNDRTRWMEELDQNLLSFHRLMAAERRLAPNPSGSQPPNSRR